MKRILVIYKKNSASAQELGKNIIQWLEKRNINAVLEEAQKSLKTGHADCVITIGGDGTILSSARRFACSGIPIFGINFGRIGFLCAATVKTWQNELEKAINGDLEIKKCLALGFKIIKKNSVSYSGIAANDVVISRGALARLVALKIMINGQYAGLLRGDGIICYTPLGSSGYNVSAGGPLLNTNLRAIGITPLCPFLPHAVPYVWPSETAFDLAIEDYPADCFITVDGQVGRKLEKNDIVNITGIENAILFYGNTCIFEKLELRGLALENGTQDFLHGKSATN